MYFRKPLVLFLVFIFTILPYGRVFAQQVNFETFLARKLAGLTLKDGNRVLKEKISLYEICDLNDPVASRVFREYGAMFVGRDDIFAGFRLVNRDNKIKFFVNCVFRDEREVNSYQTSIRTKTATIGGTTIELREDAMRDLLEAVEDAREKGLRITPRGGSISAKRSYQDTARLWDSRFFPALNHWVRMGKISRAAADEARTADVTTQVQKVFEWEDRKLWFSKDLSKSILYSVAAPGASQHIFMVALDVEQYGNPKVRELLAEHGWFQTVKSDLPHFTYLGVDEDKLPSLGLKRVLSGGQAFWIPNMN